MKLHTISIIPIELFTQKCASLVKNHLLKEKYIHEVEGEETVNIFSEITANESELYSVSPHIDPGIYLVFYESSACFYIEKAIEGWVLSRESVVKELRARNSYHKEIRRNSEKLTISKIIKEIFSVTSGCEYGVSRINYVFSFYVVEGKVKGERDILNLKILAEPSLIDLDDMKSTHPNDSIGCVDTEKINTSYINSLPDVDISSNAKTYITWATVVSVVDKRHFNKTKSLLVALECQLQTIWNRCYSVSRFIDKIFESTNKPRDVEDLYWNFVKTLDVAKSVLSSTYSSRADKLFSEMILTSKIEGEIDRLGQKIDLLEKYIDKNNQKLSKKYQKTIELLLFITALASLAQVFFPLPMSFLPTVAEYFVMAVFALVGALAIYKSR